MKHHVTRDGLPLILKGFFVFIFTLAIMYCKAQGGSINAGLSPGGRLETVFDRFGDKYTLGKIKIAPIASIQDSNVMLSSTMLCSTGIFNLYFEAGSGMEGNSLLEANRRNVVCQVFSDLSNFIKTPLHNAGNTTKVNIWIRNITQISNVNAATLGVATGFYNVPSSPNVIAGGIIDNEVWKTIHSGVDSYTNVANPLVTSSGVNFSSGLFYHGMLAINPNISWNTNLLGAAASSEIDLYTVVLHEVTHALGIASLIDYDGNSRFVSSNTYYSRYDSFLKNHNVDLIRYGSSSCSIMYDNNFTGNPNVLHPNCGLTPAINNGNSIDHTDCPNVYLNFAGTFPIPIYAPTCFERGSSLSHFEDECYVNPSSNAFYVNNSYFVMSNVSNYGSTKRYLKSEERTALCDVGYNLSNRFGGNNNVYGNSIDYGTENSCVGIGVAGINDGISNNFYSYTTTVNQAPINITGILNNDVCYTYDAYNNATNIPNNLRFECVQDVYDATATIITVGNDINGIIRFSSGVSGVHLLRYVPYDIVTGKRGNITYFYVFVGAGENNCGIPSSCGDLVINGDFEQYSQIPDQFSQINYTCNWSDANNGTADFFRTDSPPTYTTPSDVRIPNNYFGSQPVNNGLGNAYAGIWSIRDINGGGVSYKEILTTKLQTPLQPHTTYQLKFDVSLSDNYRNNPIRMQAYIGTEVPTPLLLHSASNLPTSTTGIFFENSTPSIDFQNWETISTTFTTDGVANQQYLYIGGLKDVVYQNQNPYDGHITSTGSYYYVDNISLVKIENSYLNLPDTVCDTSVLPDLTNYLQYVPPTGVFSGHGVVATGVAPNVVYSFNPSVAGVGSSIIYYTYTTGPGCASITISHNITILHECALPFISQTYSVDGVNQFIEVKNSSLTQSIPTSKYYLDLYQDGHSLSDDPTSYIEIGPLAPQEVRVFKYPTADTPAYACSSSSISLPVDFMYDGNRDILLLSTAKYGTVYADRVDIMGDFTSNCEQNTSLVRSNCATSYPKLTFDLEDWVGFTPGELQGAYDQTSKTNAILGRHNDDNLVYGTSGWVDNSLDMSNPDRSRMELLNSSYTTQTTGSFEACALVANASLNIAPNDYVSIQSSLNNQSSITVQNNGALVMVKDQFHGVVGNALITGNPILINRSTVGLDAVTDYVYWATPLTNDSSNLPANSVNNLFPSPPFISSRFFQFHNENFQDLPNYWVSPNNCCDGYDDNLDDYLFLNAGQRAGLMKPGYGYCTWAKSLCGSGCNYTISFNGKPNNGLVTVPVYHNAPSNAYTNLVGNPYPSAIDLDRLFEVNAGLIDPVAYIWGRTILNPTDTPSSSNSGPMQLNYSQDNYAIYNPTMMILPASLQLNSAFNDPTGSGVSLNGALASCQSFFVNTTNYGGDLIFNNSMRTTLPNNTFMKQATLETKNKLWLNLKNDKQAAQLGIAFLDNATDKYNPKEDVKTISGRNLNFYTKSTEEDLIIDAQATFTSDKILPLGITALNNNNQNYSIGIEKVTSILQNQRIFIEDKLLGKVYEITKNDYTFTLNGAITDDRFVLRFTNELSSPIADTNNVEVIYNSKNLQITSLNVPIQTIIVNDIYTHTINAQEVTRIENVNSKSAVVPIDDNYKLIQVKLVLQDGTVVTKKMIK